MAVRPAREREGGKEEANARKAIFARLALGIWEVQLAKGGGGLGTGRKLWARI